jgi:hypothetical protein
MLLKSSEKIATGAAETTFVVMANPEANTPNAPTKANMAHDDGIRFNMPKSYSYVPLQTINRE